MVKAKITNAKAANVMDRKVIAAGAAEAATKNEENVDNHKKVVKHVMSKKVVEVSPKKVVKVTPQEAAEVTPKKVVKDISKTVAKVINKNEIKQDAAEAGSKTGKQPSTAHKRKTKAAAKSKKPIKAVNPLENLVIDNTKDRPVPKKLEKAKTPNEYASEFIELAKNHETDSFVTAEDLYFKAKQADDTISLSTIYRILELFNKKNIVQKTTLLEDDKAVFELNHIDHHHHHLICLGCKKVIDIGQCPLGSFEKDIEATTDFSIVDHKLEIYGYCKDCKKDNTKKV